MLPATRWPRARPGCARRNRGGRARGRPRGFRVPRGSGPQFEARLEGAAERRDEAAARIREEMELAPEQLLETVGIDLDAGTEDLPGLDVVEIDVTRLRRQRDALGAVNLRAEEDADEIKAERDADRPAEKDDLEAAIAKLRAAIAELNREGRERIIRAFDQVNEKFAELFRHLFGGGEARLVMVDSEDPLEAGLEILCQPPGKKLSTLSLLSGGEQTLTALSADLRRVPVEPGADLRARRGRRAARRRQREPVLRPAWTR